MPRPSQALGQAAGALIGSSGRGRPLQPHSLVSAKASIYSPTLGQTAVVGKVEARH